ncbi:MAG: hypothetical protein GF328_15530 [Candidatus Latescibacteria bacterium]|nr:hypothetical protein [Candidatus Latescibacterota bacterium]
MVSVFSRWYAPPDWPAGRETDGRLRGHSGREPHPELQDDREIPHGGTHRGPRHARAGDHRSGDGRLARADVRSRRISRLPRVRSRDGRLLRLWIGLRRVLRIESARGRGARGSRQAAAGEPLYVSVAALGCRGRFARAHRSDRSGRDARDLPSSLDDADLAAGPAHRDSRAPRFPLPRPARNGRPGRVPAGRRRQDRGEVRRVKVVGVLGIGPQATIDFETRVLIASQKVLPANANTGYPILIVCHLREAPSALRDDGTPVFPLRPAPALLEAAAWLGQRCDFLVMPANSPHVHEEAIERAAGRSLLSMVDLAVESVCRRGWKRAGVLGFLDPAVSFYTDRLRARGLEAESIDQRHQAALDTAIIRVMEGREGEADRAAARTAVDLLRRRGADGVILGCTEIPLLLGEEPDERDTVDPVGILAPATVAYALEDNTG